MSRLVLILFFCLTLVASALPGLSPVWERLYNNNEPFSETNPDHSPTADPDGDGWSNIKESRAGTDPFLSVPGQGFLQPKCISHPWLENAFLISWSARIGKDYQLQLSPDLQSWTSYGDSISGYNQEIALTIAPDLDGNGTLPSKLFWRVAVGSAVATGMFDPWELDILMTHSHLRVPGWNMPIPGTVEAGAGPDSDGSGPNDYEDASRHDRTIDWERLPEARYLFVPANHYGTAVDMNDQGKILYANDKPINDYATEEVGAVWNPFPGQNEPETSKVYFYSPFQLWMWKAAHAPNDEGSDELTPDDDLVKETVLWPPPVNDDSRFASAQVRLKAIADDGTVMGDVSYGMAEFFNGAPESPSRIVGGSFVFLWGNGAYDAATILGNDRGYQNTIESSSRNTSVGFYHHATGQNSGIKAVITDHPTHTSGHPTSFVYRVHNLDQPGTPQESLSAENSMPQGDDAGGKITPSGKIIYRRKLAPGIFQYVVAGTAGRIELPKSTSFHNTFMDLPAETASSRWALGTGDEQLRIWSGGSFLRSPSATGVLQFDRSGTGIGNGSVTAGQQRFIWRNGQWFGLEEALNIAPGSLQGMKPRKITPSGLIWISNADSTVNGVLVPIVVKDNAVATGVDDESIKAHRNDKGYQNSFWIMSPCGDDPNGQATSNESHFLLPATSSVTLGLSASPAVPDPANFGVVSAPTSNTVRWHSTGNASGETLPSFTLSGKQVIGNPVGVKTMKRRTINISIVRVKRAGGPSVVVPSESALKLWLEKVYGWQLNAWPNVTVEPQELEITPDYDSHGNPEVVWPSSQHTDSLDLISVPTADIVVVLLGDMAYRASTGYIGGIAPDDGGQGPIFIATWAPKDTTALNLGIRNRYSQDVIETIAHEMGHRLFGEGHPDQGFGQAPLDGTNRRNRLMASGKYADPQARLIVKKEWDKAELWLQTYVDN